MSDINADEIKRIWLSHAKILLDNLKDSNITVAIVSKYSGIHIQQIYAYKDGRRDINKARMETLIKFENAYQNLKCELNK